MKERHRVLHAATVLACGLAAMCRSIAGAPAAVTWHAADGYRYRELSVGVQGGPGFSLLLPGATGLDFTNVLTDARAVENQIRLNGSGVALGDVDRDGWCDIYFCSLEGSNVLYRNLGGWRFVQAAASGGIEASAQFSTGSTLVDIDGDDDLDLLVNGIGAGTRLFLNDGGGTFHEATGRGLSRRYGAMTSTLGDIDGDGTLDLYVANYRTATIRTTGFAVLNVGGQRRVLPEDRDRLEITADGRVLEHGEADLLYQNGGGASFMERSWTDGSFLDEEGKPLARPPLEWGLSAMFRDLNGDGAPDLYVCNDFHSIDRIWINDGQGRFRAIPGLALRHVSTFSMAVDVADLNHDGYDDLFVVDMLGLRHPRRMMQMAGADPYPYWIGGADRRLQFDRNTLQLNRGDGTYADVAYYAGLEASDWTWSVVFLDVDLDGHEDILCTTGHMFDTQDPDAESRIQAMGPWRRDLIPQKLLHYPRAPMRKVAFHNQRDLTFRESGQDWGFNQTGVAHGMALADLDNDGDLDVVVNELNGPAAIYRNESAAPRVGVRLKGQAPNTSGIGGKVRLYGGAVPVQSQEMICGGRYLSGDEPMRVFAAGSLTNEMRIEVVWRSGKRSVINGVRANRIYEVEESRALGEAPVTIHAPAPMYEDVSALISHTHVEEPYDDAGRQPLLPMKLSHLGPGAAWGDLNGDGRDDLVVGSGKGGSMGVWVNDGRGKFNRLDEPWMSRVVARDQSGLVIWVKAPGQTAVLAGSANYEDDRLVPSSVRHYDFAGRKIEEDLPAGPSSTGPVVMGDLDADGDLDLFVGGRVIGGRYPEAAEGRVYRNEGGKWVFDAENSKAFEQVGLLGGAVWSDLDGDGYPELVLGCEWGPIKVFKNRRGQLSEITRELGLGAWTGWWNGVTTGDLDGDGRLDIVAGNQGLNTKYRASVERPRKLYYGDLNRSGRVELVEAYFDGEREVPERDLNAVAEAMPWVRETFGTHAAYAQAGIGDIFGERLKDARVLEVNCLKSMVFLNRGDHFEGQAMPAEAQFSPIYGVCVGDFDGDGQEDVFVSQNLFSVGPATSRNDAGRGLWLKGDGQGGLNAVKARESGVRIYGEQRGAALCDYDEDGRVDLVVTQNGAQTKLYRNLGARAGLRVRLRGGEVNPSGIGAQLRLIYGQRTGPTREIHGGSGYWSQDSAVQVLGCAESPTGIQVLWPGGSRVSYPVSAGVREVELTLNGGVRSLK